MSILTCKNCDNLAEICLCRECLAETAQRPDVQTGDDKARALLRWGTWDMTPAARLDWKNRVEEFLSSTLPSAEGK